MQTKFWIVKLAQYRGVFAIPAPLSSSPPPPSSSPELPVLRFPVERLCGYRVIVRRDFIPHYPERYASLNFNSAIITA